MAWLVAAAVLLVSYLYASGRRKPAVILGVVFVVAGVSLYVFYQRQQVRETSLIAVTEVKLENVTLNPTFRSSYDLIGTVRNDSASYRLDGFEVTVTLRDCAGADASRCSPLGEASAFAAISVPPRETREFIAPLHFGGDRPQAKGRLDWGYEVTAVTARRQ